MSVLKPDSVASGVASSTGRLAVGAAKPAICFVAPYGYAALSGDWHASGVGGAEIQQAALARAFAARGYPVRMITLDFGQPNGLEVGGVVVVPAFRESEGWPGVRYFHPRMTTMARRLASIDADVFYVRSASYLLGLVTFVARSRGCSVLYAGAHDLDFQPGREQIRFARDRLLFRFGLRRADAVVVQNPTQEHLCQRHYGVSATVIRSMYDGIGKQGRADGHVLWVATLRRWKRPELFLDLAEALPHLQFHMAGGEGGDPAFVAEIKARAARIKNLAFHGFLPYPDVERLFDGARIFVNTSETEGFPNTFLQAWARRIPLVTLFDPGFRENGEPIGLVAKRIGDAVQHVSRLAVDDGLWQREGERCHAYYRRNHAPVQVIQDYENVLAGMLRDRRNGPPN